jgi:hypothetical protein
MQFKIVTKRVQENFSVNLRSMLYWWRTCSREMRALLIFFLDLPGNSFVRLLAPDRGGQGERWFEKLLKREHEPRCRTLEVSFISGWRLSWLGGFRRGFVGFDSIGSNQTILNTNHTGRWRLYSRNRSWEDW